MKKWFLWWLVRPDSPEGGQWYGALYRTDYEAFQEQLAIETGPATVSGIYRWVWDGSTPDWQYDDRPNSALIANSVKFSWL